MNSSFITQEKYQMVCTVPSMASGNLLLSPSLQLPKSPGTQVCASRLQGAVNSSWKVDEKSGRHFTPTVSRRKARHSPSILVRNEAPGHEAEPKADLQPKGARGERDHEGYSTKESAMLQRREIIWAATATLSYLSTASMAQAAEDPVPPTNMALKDCRLVNINGPQKTEYCCQPDGSQLRPKPFRFENLPMRTRKPAHILSKDPVYVKKYNEAYAKMIALPDNDPRNFTYQWRIHCAFCTGAYPELGNVNGLALQYHGSWSFLPWHRMYLYFHERILGELINDPSFALPFWNWDNQRQGDHGNQMPLMFTEDRGLQNNHLRDAIRNLEHYPPAYVVLGGTPQDASYERIRRDNLSVVHTGVVSATSAFDFGGGAYRPNQSQWPNAAGSAETDVHNTVHGWTGSSDRSKYPNNEDMGTFAYAARDPIFYTHHSNIDRLWSVWQGLDPSLDEATRRGSRARQDPTDEGFRETKFAFYDHKGELVEVKTEDTLDTNPLKYKYEVMESDQDWINFQKRPSGAPKPSQSDIDQFSRTSRVLSKDQSTSFQLLRRKPTAEDVPAGLEEDEVEETLVVKSCKLPMDSLTLFRVFINLPDANADTPLDIQEYTGLVSHIPHAGGSTMSMPTDLRVSAGACLKSLGIDDDEESVCVTFVPAGQQTEDVSFDDVAVEFH